MLTINSLKMKKILSILFLSVMIYSCTNQHTGTAVVKNSDELSLNAKSLLQAYFDNDFSLWEELFSDDCEVYIITNDAMDKKATIEALKQERALFNSLSVLDDYSHTNYFNNGDIWTNHWFIVNATGKFTGETNTVRVHTDLKWENGKVVVFQVYRDPSVTIKEAAAMAEMSK